MYCCSFYVTIYVIPSVHVLLCCKIQQDVLYYFAPPGWYVKMFKWLLRWIFSEYILYLPRYKMTLLLNTAVSQNLQFSWKTEVQYLSEYNIAVHLWLPFFTVLSCQENICAYCLIVCAITRIPPFFRLWIRKEFPSSAWVHMVLSTVTKWTFYI
jgi:hypothetical protein